MAGEEKDKLISAVYAATLSQDNLVDFLDQLDRLVFQDTPEGEIQPSHSVRHDDADFKATEKNLDQAPGFIIDPDLITHFHLAHEIQQKMGRPDNQPSTMKLLLDAAPNPAFIFDETEQIITCNLLANELVKTRGNSLKLICNHLEVLEKIQTFIISGIEQEILIEPGFLDDTAQINTCVLVKKLGPKAQLKTDNQLANTGNLFFMTFIDLGFELSKTKLFQSTYSLTDAEVDIAIQLATGKQAIKIAAARKVSIPTIRTQIKAIKKKTGTRDIAAIVRLLCGYSAGILVSSQLTSIDQVNPKITTPLIVQKQMRLRDGRNCTYLEQGCPTGKPVLMVHNMPYCMKLNQATLEACHQLKIRIITPYRPGHGDSDPLAKMASNQLLDTVANDFCELLDHLKIQKVLVMGMAIGTVYAQRFAQKHPSRVSSILAVSRATMWKEAWATNMPSQQRFVVRLAKYLPQLLPLVTRVATLMFDQGKGPHVIKSLLSNGQADRIAQENKETVDLLIEGNREGLRQGCAAFREDCLLAITDFTEEAKQLKTPYYILHGEDDQIVAVHQSIAFVEEVPAAKLKVIKDAGNLLIYSHWKTVVKALDYQLHRHK